MIILGLHFGHDAAVAVLRDGNVESCIIRERQTRVKHAMTLDVKTIFKAIKEANLEVNDIDYCAITSTQGVELVMDDPERVSICLGEPNVISDVPCKLSESLQGKMPSLSQVLLPCLYNEIPEYRGREFTMSFYSKLYPEYKKLKRQDIKSIGWIDNYISTDLWQGEKTLKKISETDFSPLLRSDLLRYGFHFPAQISIDSHSCPAFFINHHMCHAASSYYQSGFRESAILTHDGGNGLGYDSGMFYYAEEHKIYPLSPHHMILGCLYDYVAYFLNLGLASAGKLMGLSAYGKPRFFDRKFLGNWNDAVRLTGDDNLFDVLDHWIYHCLSLAKELGYDLDTLGDPNRITAPINADIAASTQKLFEENILMVVEILHNSLRKMSISTNNLSLSGGTALNCPANSRIFNEGRFKHIFVDPGCDDSGLAIGAALYCYHNLLNNPLLEKGMMHFITPFLGSEATQADILSALNNYSEQVSYESIENWAHEAARELADNHVIAWFQGRSEVGPRALGHRSILANPCDPNNWEKVNQVKKREFWRPLAPAVLESEAKTWFSGAPIPSPYMLFTASTKSTDIPAVIHVDGSARIQTVNEMCGAFFDLVSEFFKITGIPIVLNTSFNGPGEPIAETPMDALQLFVKSDLDTLYLNSYRVKRKRLNQIPKDPNTGDLSFDNVQAKDAMKFVEIFAANQKIKHLQTQLKYPEPMLIEDCYTYNIVDWKENYYGLPKQIGSVDVSVSSDDLSQVKGVFIEQSLDRLKALIWQVQLQQTQAERERLQFQLQENRAELQQLYAGYPKPTLIEDFGEYNIVAWRGNYYGLPKTLGPVNISYDDLSELQGIFIDISIERLKILIQNHQALLSELRHSQSQLQQTQEELRHSQSQLQQTQADLEHFWTKVQAMENSKFWKLRKFWFRLKSGIGLAKEEV